MKTVGLLDKLRHRGVERVAWIFQFTAIAYNLVRRNLLATPLLAAYMTGEVCPQIGKNRVFDPFIGLGWSILK